MKNTSYSEDSAKQTYHFNNEIDFHCFSKNSIHFMCLSERGMSLRRIYSYLENISKEFLKEYKDIKLIDDYNTNEFNEYLGKVMNDYNDPKNDQAILAQNRIDDITDTMSSNIKIMVQNHEEAASLVNRSNDLLISSNISFFN